MCTAGEPLPRPEDQPLFVQTYLQVKVLRKGSEVGQHFCMAGEPAGVRAEATHEAREEREVGKALRRAVAGLSNELNDNDEQ